MFGDPSKIEYVINEDYSDINVFQSLKNEKNLLYSKFNKSIGLNSETLFIGSTGSTFCIHTEDEDLLSVNLNVSGGNKIWYILPPASYKKVIEIINGMLKFFFK